MSDMPDEIWACVTPPSILSGGGGPYWSNKPSVDGSTTHYIKADIHEALKKGAQEEHTSLHIYNQDLIKQIEILEEERDELRETHICIPRDKVPPELLLALSLPEDDPYFFQRAGLKQKDVYEKLAALVAAEMEEW